MAENNEKAINQEEADKTTADKTQQEQSANETGTNQVSEEMNEETQEEKSQGSMPKEKIENKPMEEEIKFATPSVDEFNWDDAKKEDELYSSEERKEMEAMYDDTLSTVGENEVVDGTVISMNKREIVINIGYKSEGVVSTNEFRYNPDLKVGDTVEVYVESQEDRKGQLVLSHRKARTLRAWERINAAYEKQEVVQGYVKCRTKGGMIVDVFGIETFLPGSQIDVKPIRDYDMFVGKNMDFKVVKINQEFKNVVVSHKILIEAELEQQKKEIIAKLEKGQVLEGTVKNITSYGVFIDLGGVDGLIHITDLSWGRINHPEEIVQLDQKLNVVILDFDEDKTRIALGLKQLTPHPWDSLDENLQVGDVVKGKVVVMADYGAFVEIKPGVEGLIHVSEMSWSQHLRSAQEFLNIGDEVEAKILTLDREERKMSLGIKQLKPDPWDGIENRYSVGSKHKAKVRNFTNFGIFVEMEEGVDGLIHISDLSWTKKINHPAEFCSVGDEIEVVVLEINQENRRLSLGHKQLEENPWDVFETVFTDDSIHEGTITEFVDKGAKVALPYGVEGFASKKHLTKEDGSMPKVEEKLPFKVIEFSKDSKRIILSHTRVHSDDAKGKEAASKKAENENTKKQTKRIKNNMEKTTLGDIAELADIKNEMSQQNKPTAKPQPEVEEKPKKKEEKTTKPEGGDKPAAKKKETAEEKNEVKEDQAKENSETQNADQTKDKADEEKKEQKNSEEDEGKNQE